MTILFQQNYHFIAFFFVAFVGREGVCKNEYVFYACGNDEKNGQPLSNQKIKNFNAKRCSSNNNNNNNSVLKS